jgi:DNA-binding NtrC family response regulator
MDARILVFGGSLTARKSLCAELKRWNFVACPAGSLRSGPASTQAFEPDLILLDRRSTDTRLHADLAPFIKRWPCVSILSLEPENPGAEELPATLLTRVHCLNPPLDPWTIPFTLKRLLQNNNSTRSRSPRQPDLAHRDDLAFGSESIQARNPAFRALLQALQFLAPSPRNVVLHGEDGLEFESLARFLHHRSPQRFGPFLSVPCQPDDTTCPRVPSSEIKPDDTDDQFHHARGGTLFLNQIQLWTLERQAHLAQILREAARHSSDVQDTALPARVVASAQVPLEDLISSGRIHAELLSALDPIPLAVPPLRERQEDLIPLIQNMVERLGRQSAPPVTSIDAAAIRCLVQYSWPGNLAELESTVRSAVVRASGPMISPDLLPDAVRHARSLPVSAAFLNLDQPYLDACAILVRHIERQYLEAQLKRQRGNVAATARASRVSRRAVTLKVREYCLRARHAQNRDATPGFTAAPAADRQQAITAASHS